jgi:hypothetical protein
MPFPELTAGELADDLLLNVIEVPFGFACRISMARLNMSVTVALSLILFAKRLPHFARLFHKAIREICPAAVGMLIFPNHL